MTILLTSGLAWVKTLRTSGWRKKSLLECLRILCPLSKDVLLENWRLQHFLYIYLKLFRWPPSTPTTTQWLRSAQSQRPDSKWKKPSWVDVWSTTQRLLRWGSHLNAMFGQCHINALLDYRELKFFSFALQPSPLRCHQCSPSMGT